MTVGDPILRTKNPLSVELGPGILGNIFDGIQRPLETISKQCGKIFVPKGVEIPCLDIEKEWEFHPTKDIKVGSLISGGDIIGQCYENNLFDEHKIMTSPKAKGKVKYIAPEGNYNVREKILEVEFNNKTYEYGMSHFWPVRDPRPFAEKLVGDTPLLTG